MELITLTMAESQSAIFMSQHAQFHQCYSLHLYFFYYDMLKCAAVKKKRSVITWIKPARQPFYYRNFN